MISLRTSFLFFSLLLFFISGWSQPDLSRNDLTKKTAVAETMKQYAELKKAIMQSDSAQLNQLLSSDFKLNGVISHREWVNDLLNHYKTDSITVLDPEFSIYTNAVKVDCLVYWKYTKGDFTEETRMLTTDIWILREGKLLLQTRLWNQLED